MKDDTFFKRIFSSRVLPSWTILLFDLGMVMVSLVLAYVIRFSIDASMTMGVEFRITIVVLALLSIVFFRLFRTYANILRYSSFVDIMHLFVALTVTYALALVISWAWPFEAPTFASTGVLLISYVISFNLLAISRMAVKMLNDHFTQSHKKELLNTYIYGTKTGIDIAKALRAEADNRFRIVGFVADDPDVIGKVMMGVNVYANDDSLIEHIQRDKVEAVIVSPAKADILKKSDLADSSADDNLLFPS